MSSLGEVRYGRRYEMAMWAGGYVGSLVRSRCRGIPPSPHLQSDSFQSGNKNHS